MANVYIEPRPKGRPEGTHIDDYLVEDHADHALGTFKTQGKQSTGRKRTATHRTSPAFATSTTRKKPITGVPSSTRGAWCHRRRR
jgi:hypothetical protein